MENFINASPLPAVFVFLIAGFVLLIKGADFFVEGSSSVAKRFHVPSLVIGMTIVAMGTSLPETAVSVTASMTNNNELAVSNAVGSNIFNLMVVIGVCALFNSIPVDEVTLKRDIPISALCAVLLLGLGWLGLGDASGMVLGHLDGIVFIILFVIYLIYMAKRARQGGGSEEAEEAEKMEILPTWKSLLFIIGGGAAIAIGGDMTVDAASRVATSFGMSQTLVGLTIVSIGTSLPELATSFVAARKNEIGMALGNAIGSNIFNILMVLGIASAISPISFLTENIIDIVILLVFTLLVWQLAGSKKKIDRREGILMLVLYLIYAVYICVR